MLRPATPLSVMLFIAFVLLLLAVLSTPIIRGIPLGSFEGVDFGVFGICRPEDQGGCTGIQIGYNTVDLLLAGDPSSFDIPGDARDTLSSILIVHPVAALVTLALFIMAAVAHMHSTAQSTRYLLFVFIFLVVDSLLCILAFVVDVLLFTPHLSFGSYLVVTAAVLVTLSAVISCAMRRTLIGRKSMKKRIAQNAEMSGENYYNREAQKPTLPVRDLAMPLVGGTNGEGDELPAFATSSYGSQKKDGHSSDEQVPLTVRSPSAQSPGANGMPGEMAMGNVAGYSEPRRSISAPPAEQDQYGHPMGPAGDPYDARRGPPMNQRGYGGMSPPGNRGRGGGYGPQRGGYNGYGPPPNPGGYGQQGRGGYGQPRGGYGGPLPRGGMGMMRGGRPPQGYPNGAGPYNGQPSPANGYGPYGNQGPYGSSQGATSNVSMPSASGTNYDSYQQSERSSLPRAESPPPLPSTMTMPQPIGEVAEMDGTSTNPPADFTKYGDIRDGDADVAGMVALQQPPKRAVERHLSDGSGSKYSNEEGAGHYVPPRADWNEGASTLVPAPEGGSTPAVPAPLNVSRSAEVPGHTSPPRTSPPAGPLPPAPSSQNTYYEDVDPRFASDAVAPRPPLQGPVHDAKSYERLYAEGARSPAESDRSNFTSISQRGVNPRWQPPPPMPNYQGQMQGPPPPRRSLPPRGQDMLLNTNPDFEIQGGRAAGGRGAYPNP